MMKTFKYRIYPSKAQAKKLEQTLDICCELYNAALQERRDAWKICRKSVTYNQQQNQLPMDCFARLYLIRLHPAKLLNQFSPVKFQSFR